MANRGEVSDRTLGWVEQDSVGLVEVSAHLGAACESCSAKCGHRQAPQTVTVQARTLAPLKAGQSILLDADSGALAQISLSLYLIPAFGFLCAAFLAYSNGLGDALQGVFGLTGLVLGLLIARVFLRRRYAAGTPLCAVQPTDN